MFVSSGTVAILMATFNGERYLAEQIDSIINQTYTDWVLFIRDDGSTDGTVNVIDRYCANYPDKIIRIFDSSEKHGSSANFANLQQFVTNNYDFSLFMFADQDDVWLTNKIELSAKRIHEFNDNQPVLIHTDLKVVDKNLNELDKSYVGYRALRPDFKDINHLLIQNNATGCTMMWNKPLNDIISDSLSIDGIIQHDWWMSLVASGFGKIEFLSEPTILYRQHDRNEIGATKVNSLNFIRKRFLGRKVLKEKLVKSVYQAEVFFSCYGSELDQKNAEVVKAFSNLYNKGKINRVLTIIRYGFYKQGLVQVIGELVLI